MTVEFWTVTDRADYWGDGAEFRPSSFSGPPQIFLLSLPFLFSQLFDHLLGIILRPFVELHLLERVLVAVSTRAIVFVILNNFPGLILAHCVVERTEGFRDFGLNVCSASDIVLFVP